MEAVSRERGRLTSNAADELGRRHGPVRQQYPRKHPANGRRALEQSVPRGAQAFTASESSA